MLVFHNKHVVGKNLAVLVNRVHIKNEQPSGVHIARNAFKRPLHVLFVGQVIDTVQRANARIDRFRQRERLHLLLHKEDRLTCLDAFLHGKAEHVRAGVGAEHVHAALTQQKRQAAGAAGEVERSAHGMAEALCRL